MVCKGFGMQSACLLANGQFKPCLQMHLRHGESGCPACQHAQSNTSGKSDDDNMGVFEN